MVAARHGIRSAEPDSSAPSPMARISLHRGEPQNIDNRAAIINDLSPKHVEM